MTLDPKTNRLPFVRTYVMIQVHVLSVLHCARTLSFLEYLTKPLQVTPNGNAAERTELRRSQSHVALRHRRLASEPTSQGALFLLCGFYLPQSPEGISIESGLFS